MPIQKGSSDKVVSKNIRMEIVHGKNRRQAIAIAMRMSGKKKKKNMNQKIAEAQK